MAEVDWREMFANYVLIVSGEEGIDFLNRGDSPYHEGRQWTDDEKAAIDELLGDDRWRN